MRRPILLALAVAIASSAALSAPKAAELTVAQGCELPKGPAGGHEFYIDPIHGSMSNDGSKQHPWRTLAEVLAPSSHLISSFAYVNYAKGDRTLKPVNPQGPVKAGDTLVLMSGDHGDVDLRQYENKDFIYVVAGKDQTPVISKMLVLAASRWYFKGLKFQGVRPQKTLYGAMVEVGYTDYFGPTDNIVFATDSFSTQDDISKWADADWVSKPYDAAFRTKSRCTALFSSHFYNVRNAVVFSGDNSVAAANLIENMGNDGFDLTASNLTISHNVIRNGHHTPAEPLHADGIQGWTLKGATNRNIRIEGNFVTDLNQSDNNNMQGISIFDGKWDGVEIVNNVVVTNTWHGVALYGVDNAKIINNTVLPSRPAKFPAWIMVHSGKDKNPSSHVIVRNNIAEQIIAGGIDVVVDHNIATGRIQHLTLRGIDPAQTSATFSFNIENVPPDAIFRSFDVQNRKFDLRLAAKSPALGAGSAQDAPAVDIDGRPRKPPIDIGAYAAQQ